MLDVTRSLPEDPDELRAFTTISVTEVKAQAVLIEKLRHQVAGARAHRFGASSETAEPLQLALEMSGIAIAAITAKLRLPEDTPADKPKRRQAEAPTSPLGLNQWCHNGSPGSHSAHRDRADAR